MIDISSFRRFLDTRLRTLGPVVAVLAVGLVTKSDVAAQPIQFDSERWQIEANQSEMTTFLDRDCLMLKGGIAWIKDADFTNGIIEFDIAFTGERGFIGAIWRMVDEGNHEEFYIRPHQTGLPDATQYTPVFNGISGWQLYNGVPYGDAVDLDPSRWLHIKIVFAGRRADIFVDDMTTPLQSVPEMKREVVSGRVGIMAGNFAPGYFSNFRYEQVDAPLTADITSEPVEVAAGMVTSWQVSDVFDETMLDGNVTPKRSYQWDSLVIEPPGFVNIARIRALQEGGNTVFAKVVVQSQGEQVKLLHFGYSDRARVYLNDRLLYTGDNTYRSRDYRYLGTIGLFDGVPLHLKDGKNELWIAVSESFGGWGVMAKFADLDGITLATD